MLVISSREFRQNQKKYFEKVDSGEHIIVQRGKDKAYALTPVQQEDMYFNTEQIKKIEESISEIKRGDALQVTKAKEISDLLGI